MYATNQAGFPDFDGNHKEKGQCKSQNIIGWKYIYIMALPILFLFEKCHCKGGPHVGLFSVPC